MKKLSLLIYSNLILATLFTLCSVSFSVDVSMLAFPISFAFTFVLVYTIFFELLKNGNAKKLSVIRRLLQYEPFVFISIFVIQRAGKEGKSYALDFVAVLLWLFLTILSFVTLYYLSNKKLATINNAWIQEDTSEDKKSFNDAKSFMRRVGIEIIEWIDALIQAVFTIILLNIFLFQLYEIPSESMVPTFLIKDRVAVVKTLCGPKFPLSNVGLPYLQNYKRGDIVVFRNPHYANDHQNEVKTFISQFLYSLTLTLVKMNTDENGELKADPLVKRVVGLPGEQLMLMDGNLYIRTKDSNEFKLQEKDAKWAAWDLNGVDKNTKKKIHWIPLTEEQYANVLKVEEDRRSLNLAQAAKECKELSETFKSLAQGAFADEQSVANLFTSSNLYEYNFFSSINDNTVKLLTVDGGAQWFEKFMNSWYKGYTNLSSYKETDVTGSNLVGENLYEDSLFRLNVMVKLVAGRLIVRNAQLLTSEVPSYDWNSDEYRILQFEKAQLLNEYILRMDQRNMPIFPANDANGNAQYIPSDNYFMMGDNRYNSLDMRHSYDQTLVRLDKNDNYSICYYTNIEPQYVSKNRILGKANLRFWPWKRFAVISGK